MKIKLLIIITAIYLGCNTTNNVEQGTTETDTTKNIDSRLLGNWIKITDDDKNKFTISLTSKSIKIEKEIYFTTDDPEVVWIIENGEWYVENELIYFKIDYTSIHFLLNEDGSWGEQTSEYYEEFDWITDGVEYDVINNNKWGWVSKNEWEYFERTD